MGSADSRSPGCIAPDAGFDLNFEPDCDLTSISPRMLRIVLDQLIHYPPFFRGEEAEQDFEKRCLKMEAIRAELRRRNHPENFLCPGVPQ